MIVNPILRDTGGEHRVFNIKKKNGGMVMEYIDLIEEVNNIIYNNNIDEAIDFICSNKLLVSF